MALRTLYLKNFRNFSTREISFLAGKNIIIWNNGQWKSNLLEALSLPVWWMVESHWHYLISRGSEVMYLKYELTQWTAAYAYDLKTGKKKFFLWEKSTTPAKLRQVYPHVISFHPMMMNLMYLWPNHRREFLDSILISSFPEYQKILSKYKKVLTSRNKVLKNISLEKSEISELDFWNTTFIDLACEIYTYRKKLSEFIQLSQQSLSEYFFGKVQSTVFSYITKVDIQNPREDISNYIKNNLHKEILLRKTLRWPHLDDFDILVDTIPLIHFASRWEVKSILLWLKFLETSFIEHHSEKKDIIYIIDDLLSELDSVHRELLWEHIWSRQCIMSSIEDIDIPWNKIYI
jgi:DNA replication and repair protein RecF